MEPIKRTRKEILPWEFDGTTWHLNPNAKGLVPYMEPDETGRAGPPSGDRIDEFLIATLDPSELEAFVAACHADELPEPERYEMALAGWKNLMGFTEIRNKQQELADMIDKQKDATKRALLEVAATAMATAEKASEAEPDPFGD